MYYFCSLILIAISKVLHATSATYSVWDGFFGQSTTYHEDEIRDSKILKAVNVSSTAELNENVMMKLNKNPWLNMLKVE